MSDVIDIAYEDERITQRSVWIGGAMGDVGLDFYHLKPGLRVFIPAVVPPR